MVTKKCKYCQTDIDNKAKVCPNCKKDLRSWFVKHPILTVILALFVLGIIASLGSGSKNKTTESSNVTNTPEVAQVPQKIKASELTDDFDANQVAAEAKWKGKLVEFSSEITNITDSGLSFSKASSKDFSLTQIGCRISDKQQLLSVKNGQVVTVRGIVGGQMIGVIDVSNCSIVQ